MKQNELFDSKLSKKEEKKEAIEEAIEILQDWCWKKRWSVVFDTCGYDIMDPNEKLIHINVRQGIEKQYYALLHEIGHLLLLSSDRYAEYHPVLVKSEINYKNKSIQRSISYKVDVLSEEIEAWKRGKKLAKRLKLFMDEDAFTKLSSEMIFSYVQWATN